MASQNKLKNLKKLLKKQGERGKCRFTRAKVEYVDYKDVPTLQKMVSAQGKMYGRKRTGTMAHFQRKVRVAVKRARYIGLLPYVGR